MELQPDPNHEGGLIARADAGERLVAKTKAFKGAGLVERASQDIFLRGEVVAEMVEAGEDVEVVQEKIVQRIDQEDGDTRRTVTLVEGVVAVVPVYNEKIKKEELLPVKNGQLIEELAPDVDDFLSESGKGVMELPVADTPEPAVVES